MIKVWRLNIKTASKKGVDPRRFCLDNNILGIGWQVEVDGEIGWDAYYKEAKNKYSKYGRSWTVAINVLKKRMRKDHLCWVRDHDGTYYLGIISSDWKYVNEPSHKDADVVNIRDCVWYKVGTVDLVPGKVVNSYISGSTVQAVDDIGVINYSMYIANKLSGEYKYSIENNNSDFLSLISSDDCEDLVGIYLQYIGYNMIASSCKSDTAFYEYVMKHRETGEKAVAQVKQGAVDLNIDKYSKLGCKVYLLTTKGDYIGKGSQNVHCLDPNDMTAFALNNYYLMTERIQRWIDFTKHQAYNMSILSNVI